MVVELVQICQTGQTEARALWDTANRGRQVSVRAYRLLGTDYPWYPGAPLSRLATIRAY